MKKIIILIKIFLFLFFTFIVINLSFYVYAFITPKFNINTSNSIIMYDSSLNNILDDEEKSEFVKLEDISDNVKNAIISIEDKNFYSHKGFDYLRILKALIVNLSSRKIKQGASTISQQYVKNLYLTFDQTLKRKMQEAILTIELETHYSKDEILEGYLNTINFGSGQYGIKAASEYYFNKEPKDLSLEEASILVGIPKNPTYYNPITNYDNAKKRQKDVLNSMVKNKYISKKEMNNIYNKQLTFYGINNKTELSSLNYYKDAVLNELKNIKNMPDSITEIQGLKIYTNLDRETQKLLENNINNEMNNTSMEVASIVVKPQTGKIVALIGGKDYSKSQYNRAVNSKRQVGSTIKPFLYYSALEQGFTPSTNFLSEKTTFNLGNISYSPKNAGNIYANKNISMLAAIAYSDNVYALKTHLFLGEDSLSKTIKKVKINTPVSENASSALGTTEINIIDYSNGFITLANEGKHENPHLIEKITDINNNVLYEYKYENEYILNKKYVYILNNLLTSTYNYSLVNYTSPTLISVSNELDSKYAVKSGSTSTDYWTVGYNKDYLVLVWAGNDNNSPVKSSESKITKKIWAKTINNINDNNKTWYEIPSDITASIIDPISGKVSKNGFVCYYEKGTEPTYDYDSYLEIFVANKKK